MKKETKNDDGKKPLLGKEKPFRPLKAGVSVKEVDVSTFMSKEEEDNLKPFMPRRADPSLELGDHYARWNESLDRIDNIHKRKSHDYANRLDRLANFRVGEKIGIPAAIMCFLRCMEKDARKSEVLIKGTKAGDMCPHCGEVIKDETLMDTCYDDTVLNLLFIELWEDFRESIAFDAIMGHFKQIKRLLEDPSYAGEEQKMEDLGDVKKIYPDLNVPRCAHDIEDPHGRCTVSRSAPCSAFTKGIL